LYDLLHTLSKVNKSTGGWYEENEFRNAQLAIKIRQEISYPAKTVIRALG
jgi:hypothetical protein